MTKGVLRAYIGAILALSIGIASMTAVCTYFFIKMSPVPPTEPPLPQEIPSDTLKIFLDDDGIYFGELGGGVWVVSKDDKRRLEFGGGSSIRGLWRGSNAKLTVISPDNSQEVFSAETNHDTWGDSLTTGNKINRDFTPWLEVTSFNLGKENYYVWVNATAEMDIVYPRVTDEGGFGLHFVNKKEHIARNFTFFAISAEDNQMISAHNSWVREMDARTDMAKYTADLTMAACVGSIFPFLVALWGGLHLNKVYHERKNV